MISSLRRVGSGVLTKVGAVALAAALLPWGAGTAWAGAAVHPGVLDPSFGGNGTVLTPLVAHSFANGILVQTPGGKTVAVGVTQSTHASYGVFAVTRYQQNGALDTSFGGSGEVTTDFGLGGTSQADAVAIAPNGKLVVVGYAQDAAGNYRWALARYLPNGSPDSTFGSGGRVTTTFGPNSGASYDFADAVTIEANGNIVVAGEASPTGSSAVKQFGVAVYLPNGHLDTGFGTGGKARTGFGQSNASANAVALSGHDIIAAGYTKTASSGFDAALAGYNATTGRLDPNFANHGKADVDFGPGDDFAHAMAVANGHILIAGSATNATQDFAIAELGLTGHLVQTFGHHGLATVDFNSGADNAASVGIDTNGDIVVAGDSQTSNDRIAIARLLPNGVLDAGFGSHGRVITVATTFSPSLAGQDDVGAFAMVVQRDQDIAVAGYAGDSTEQFALARYLQQ